MTPARAQIIDEPERTPAPWLTLVHGATQDRRLFDAQMRAFRGRFRLLLVDLPGHGESAHVPGPYGLEEYARSVLGAMDAAGLDATHFWGTHTGAAVALLLASRHLGRFRSLVLEGAVLPGVTPPSVSAALGRARRTARARGIDAARREWFERGPWFDVIRARPERCRAAEHWAMVREFPGAPWLDAAEPEPVTPIDERLQAIHRPVLLVNGEHEVADFVPAADTLEGSLPRVRRVRIEHGGGFPLWEYPQAVNRLVAQFLHAEA